MTSEIFPGLVNNIIDLLVIYYVTKYNQIYNALKKHILVEFYIMNSYKKMLQHTDKCRWAIFFLKRAY
jgi:hypothetical protein